LSIAKLRTAINTVIDKRKQGYIFCQRRQLLDAASLGDKRVGVLIWHEIVIERARRADDRAEEAKGR
jgi:hypothetical protein